MDIVSLALVFAKRSAKAQSRAGPLLGKALVDHSTCDEQTQQYMSIFGRHSPHRAPAIQKCMSFWIEIRTGPLRVANSLDSRCGASSIISPLHDSR